jgi:tubulysin polyketide synthase-like protein
MSAPELLSDLLARGVQVWRDGDLLRYRAPKGTLTDADRASIRAHKAELLRALVTCTSCNWLTPAGSCVRGFDVGNPSEVRACGYWRARVLIELPRAATSAAEPRSEPTPDGGHHPALGNRASCGAGHLRHLCA